MFDKLNVDDLAYVRLALYGIVHGDLPTPLEQADIETGPYLWQVTHALARGETPQPAPQYSSEQRHQAACEFFRCRPEKELHRDLLTTPPDDIGGDEHACKRFRIMQLYAQRDCKGWAEIARQVNLSVERVRQIAAKQFRIWKHPSFFGGYCYIDPMNSASHRYRFFFKDMDRVGEDGAWPLHCIEDLTFPAAVLMTNNYLARFGGAVTIRVKPAKPALKRPADYRTNPPTTLWYLQQAAQGQSLTTLAKVSGRPLLEVNARIEHQFQTQAPYAEQLRMPAVLIQTKPYADRYQVVDRRGKVLRSGMQLTAIVRHLVTELKARDIDPTLYWKQEYATPWPF